MQPLSLETSRLDLRWLTLDDAAFILALINDPDWISMPPAGISKRGHWQCIAGRDLGLTGSP
jgi:hypothetical protein